jgi:hypothetical protein
MATATSTAVQYSFADWIFFIAAGKKITGECSAWASWRTSTDEGTEKIAAYGLSTGRRCTCSSKAMISNTAFALTFSICGEYRNRRALNCLASCARPIKIKDSVERLAGMSLYQTISHGRGGWTATQKCYASKTWISPPIKNIEAKGTSDKDKEQKYPFGRASREYMWCGVVSVASPSRFLK